MKITNWLEAQQIIHSGKQLLDTILMKENVMTTYRFPLLEFGQDWNGHKITDFIPDKHKKLALEMAKDMREAKEYLGLDTGLEDTIQELNK